MILPAWGPNNGRYADLFGCVFFVMQRDEGDG
jgi:hypothetical protein